MSKLLYRETHIIAEESGSMNRKQSPSRQNKATNMNRNQTPSQEFIDYICSLYGDIYDDRIEDCRPPAAGNHLREPGTDWTPGRTLVPCTFTGYVGGSHFYWSVETDDSDDKEDCRVEQRQAGRSV